MAEDAKSIYVIVLLVQKVWYYWHLCDKTCTRCLKKYVTYIVYKNGICCLRVYSVDIRQSSSILLNKLMLKISALKMLLNKNFKSFAKESWKYQFCEYTQNILQRKP